MRKKPKQNSNECSQSASSISHPRPGYLLTRSKRSKTSYLFLARRLIRLFHRRTYVSFQTCVCICVCVFVWVAQLCPTLCDPMNCSPPGSFVHGILQAIYWSGLLFSSLGDLPNPGIEPRSPVLQADSSQSELAKLFNENPRTHQWGKNPGKDLLPSTGDWASPRLFKI